MKRNEPERADEMAKALLALINRVSDVFYDVGDVAKRPGERVCDEIRAARDALDEAEARMFAAVDLLDEHGIC